MEQLLLDKQSCRSLYFDNSGVNLTRFERHQQNDENVCSALGPVRAVQSTVLNRLAQVARLDAFSAVQVGDRPGNF